MYLFLNIFSVENTRSKFLFYGVSDNEHMKESLEQYLNADIIPDFLGGPCKVCIYEIFYFFFLNCK